MYNHLNFDENFVSVKHSMSQKARGDTFYGGIRKSNSMKYNICLVSPDPSIFPCGRAGSPRIGDDLRCNVIIIDGNVKTAVSHVKTYVEKGNRCHY